MFKPVCRGWFGGSKIGGTNSTIQARNTTASSEEKSEKITKNYEEFFKEALPEAEEILDTKVLKNNELRLEKKSLQERVADLTSQLKESGVIGEDGKENDIVVKVNPEKIEQISTTFLDGKKCIIIPVEDGEKATINGEKQDV